MSNALVLSVTDDLIAELEVLASGACQYSPDDWFSADSLWSAMEKDDAAYVEKASPWLVRAILAERAELKRDAARYWKLRYGSGWPAVFADSNNPEPLRMVELDAAIDAAMQS